MIARMMLERVPRPGWAKRCNEALGARMSAGIVIVLSGAALMLSGFKFGDMERAIVLTPAAGVLVAAVAAWFGYEVSSLVTGLVIGQLLQAPLAQYVASNSGVSATMTLGSAMLVLVTLGALGAALAWRPIGRSIIQLRQAKL